jgi:2-methylisocitrate lyase-like PEP mutase family enzyme
MWDIYSGSAKFKKENLVRTTTLLRKLVSEKTVLAIGDRDTLSARIVEMVGFDAV